MTINEVLTAEGLTADEIKVLTENPKYAGALTKLLSQSEEGTTALLKAQELEQSIRKFNDETVIPYGAKKDQETAKARAESAKYQEYLKSMKEAGYDIPDAYLTAAPTETPKIEPAQPKYMQASDLDNQGKAYMALLSASERARDLLGHGLDIEAEYEDFGKNRRPNEVLRSYIDRKYDLAAKDTARKEEKAKKEREAIENAAIERYKTEHPETSNPELRMPAASKFDRVKSQPDERKNLWQTQRGREEATKARRDKYSDLLVN